MVNSVFAYDEAPSVYISHLAANYIAAEHRNHFYKTYPSTSIELAYLIQAYYVQQKAKPVIGYKVGLSSAAAQRKFKHQSPVFGVLLQQPNNEKVIKEQSAAKRLLEVELGFKIKTSITQLVQLDQPIEDLVSSVAPVIEIPTINFKDIKTVTVFDIIATNVGAATFIAGDFVDLNQVDVNKLVIELWHESEKIMQGLSNTPFDSQYDALAWLLRQALLQGYDLEKGHVLLTGSILKPVFITPGKYTAKFHGLHNINLQVK